MSAFIFVRLLSEFQKQSLGNDYSRFVLSWWRRKIIMAFTFICLTRSRLKPMRLPISSRLML